AGRRASTRRSEEQRGVPGAGTGVPGAGTWGQTPSSRSRFSPRADVASTPMFGLRQPRWGRGARMSPRGPHDSPPGEPAPDGGRFGGLQSVVEIVSPRVAVVSLVGNVDLSSYDVIESLLDNAQRDVLIDLTRCEFVDSTGIGA